VRGSLVLLQQTTCFHGPTSSWNSFFAGEMGSSEVLIPHRQDVPLTPVACRSFLFSMRWRRIVTALVDPRERPILQHGITFLRFLPSMRTSKPVHDLIAGLECVLLQGHLYPLRCVQLLIRVMSGHLAREVFSHIPRDTVDFGAIYTAPFPNSPVARNYWRWGQRCGCICWPTDLCVPCRGAVASFTPPRLAFPVRD
jgi:hypothetical protein